MRIRTKLTAVNIAFTGRDGQNNAVLDASVTLAPSVDGDGIAVNSALWAAGPVATLELRSIKQSIALSLVPGSDYYLDINPV